MRSIGFTVYALVLISVLTFGCSGKSNSPALAVPEKINSDSRASEPPISFSKTQEIIEIPYKNIASFNGMENGELVGEIKTLLSDSGIESILSGSRAMFVSVSEENVTDAKMLLKRFQIEKNKSFHILDEKNAGEPVEKKIGKRGYVRIALTSRRMLSG